MEFRHASWYADNTFEMLDHHGASLVLHDQAEQIHEYLQEGKDVYAYFNNTMGAAFDNAQDLYRLVVERA